MVGPSGKPSRRSLPISRFKRQLLPVRYGPTTHTTVTGLKKAWLYFFVATANELPCFLCILIQSCYFWRQFAEQSCSNYVNVLCVLWLPSNLVCQIESNGLDSYQKSVLPNFFISLLFGQLQSRLTKRQGNSERLRFSYLAIFDLKPDMQRSQGLQGCRRGYWSWMMAWQVFDNSKKVYQEKTRPSSSGKSAAILRSFYIG